MVLVAQLGARQHYEIPLLCHSKGALVRLHTDFWDPIPDALKPLALRLGGRPARRLVGRRGALPDDLVSSHFASAALWHVRQRLVAGDRAKAYRLFAAQGTAFARSVARTLPREHFTTFFGFSSASLEALEQTRDLGRLAVLDEIAPTHLEDEIIAAEQNRFPGWEPAFSATPDVFLHRIEAEWATADRILVNSGWTRDALIARGAVPGKINVVPIAYAVAASEPKLRSPGEPLRVLWLGTLNLRKGLPYALEAARMLEDAPVRFTFAGPTAVDLDRADPLPRNAGFAGQIPRVETARLWADHHLFLLPTLSDGFAITQIEAMAHGLPVIATSHCGEVVEAGRSGLIVPARDPQAIAEAVRAFIDGSMDLEAASAAAIARARDFAPDAVWPRLRAVLTQ
jgi:glycosyltransferase involved in cell wall biosynthesis